MKPLSYLFKEAPWYVRWPVYIATFIITSYGTTFVYGFKFNSLANAYVDERIEMKMKPRREFRDLQYKTLSDKIDTQGKMIGDIHNYILYGKRPNP